MTAKLLWPLLFEVTLYDTFLLGLKSTVPEKSPHGEHIAVLIRREIRDPEFWFAWKWLAQTNDPLPPVNFTSRL